MIRTTLLAVFAALVSAGATAAQTHDTTPAWMVSKPVNKIANKKLFEDHRLRASHIMAATASYPNWVSAKAVHRHQKAKIEGNVPSKGYPTWTISKAIHR